MEAIPRLDVLLYAHDGRGLGHASRTIAIGAALRRLAPDLRVLFISGCRLSQELIGDAPLDWLKLPSYETVVEGGKSRGVRGKSNFTDGQLGRIRSEQILDAVKIYRPRLILADHSPQGKHKELLPALQAKGDAHCVLGLRGIVGQVSQVKSALASSIFENHYTSLLWYGDSGVLGNEQLLEIQKYFKTSAVECGYVSGIRERSESLISCSREKFACTVSVPWIGENTPAFLKHLYNVIAETGDGSGKWMLYLDDSHPRSAEFYALFRQLSWCDIEKPGRRYGSSLRNSRCALIYGGYNSLVDVLSLSLPALVILRDMQDDEQQQHLLKLRHSTASSLAVLPEECSEEQLAHVLHNLPHRTSSAAGINLDGAVNAAKHLLSLLGEGSA